MSLSFEIKQYVDQCYLRAQEGIYWHHVVKNHKTEDFYKKNSQKINELIKKIGISSLEKADVRGLTPLHVAVICGNQAGARFLLNRGVKVNPQDSSQSTAIDYAQQFCPKLLSYFPHLSGSKVFEILGPILKAARIPLIPGDFVYKKYTEDFGRAIEELYVSKDLRETHGIGRVRDIFENLEQHAMRLGFRIKRSSFDYPVRDHFFRHVKSGDVLLEIPSPADNPSIALSVDRAHSEALYFGKKGFALTQNPFFKVGIGKTQKVSLVALEDVKNFHQVTHLKHVSSHLEGGNVIMLSNAKGNPIALVSRDHFYSTISLHRINKKFDDLYPMMKIHVEKIKQTMTNAKVLKVAEQMYAQGMVIQEGHSAFIEYAKVVALSQQESSEQEDTSFENFRDRAIKKGFIQPFNKKGASIHEFKELTSKYLFQKYLTRTIMARELGLEAEELCFIKPLHYHLDTFIKPGPKGSAFVADFALSANLIDALLKNDEGLEWSEEDKRHLQIYLETARKMDKEFQTLIKDIHKKLVKVDITPIPTPGLFFYEDKTSQETFNINFMNALSGWSKNTKNYYFITTGAEVGQKVGRILMDTFHVFLDFYQPGIEVYYVGKDDQGKYKEPMELWNKDNSQSGLHCFTFESATQDHEEKGARI
ncbi:MAG: hypothetical protein BGO14_00440 [Chlamydiales bacterium 38-26]|nr:ankyrin repeat domain-containing protein [Chlamydiales bacterium]OJV07193.1 MAG: hypothetical protein BGO14_00440 [Chlamydiales bacterium 38-26]